MPGSSDLRALADEDLMQLMQRSDPRAFEVIYERHSGAAFSLAYRMVGRGNVAEDVVQEAFLSIWRSGARYERTRGSVRTWVLGIVHHRAIDQLRRSSVHDKRRASDEGLEERLESRERTEGEVARREEAATIRSAMDSLPAEQSHVIELAYFGGFTHTEIAEILGAPVGTVKGRMRLGLEKLRNSLADAGDAVDMSPAHDHDRWADSLGAWLLGALPEDEAEGFRRHLEQCAVCREDAAGLQPAVDVLPASAEPRTPPPALKDRIMARESRPVDAAGRSRRAPHAPLLVRRLRLAPRAGRGARGARARLRRRAGAPGRHGDDHRAGQRPGQRRARDRQTASGTLVAKNLPAPPRGRVYQVWLDKGGKAPEPTDALFATRSTAPPRSTCPARSTASSA